MDSAPTTAIATEGSEMVPIDIDGDCKMGEVDEDEDTMDHVLPLLDSIMEACTTNM